MPFSPADSDGIRFKAVDDLQTQTVQYPSREELERYVGVAVNTRPILRSLEASLASRNIDVTAAANAVLPQLDVVAAIGSEGLQKGFADSFNETLTGQAISGAVGMRFSMFIGQRAARSLLSVQRGATRLPGGGLCDDGGGADARADPAAVPA